MVEVCGRLVFPLSHLTRQTDRVARQAGRGQLRWASWVETKKRLRLIWGRRVTFSPNFHSYSYGHAGVYLVS